jgi:hypothetical protein
MKRNQIPFLVSFLLFSCDLTYHDILPSQGKTFIHVTNSQGEDLLNPNIGGYEYSNINVTYSSKDIADLSTTRIGTDSSGFLYEIATTFSQDIVKNKIAIPETDYSIIIRWDLNTRDTINYTVKYFDKGGAGWSDVTLNGKQVNFLSDQVTIKLEK